MQDGPGNRLVYHLTGCNMRCPWCSNPEGLEFDCEVATAREVGEVIDEAISCQPMFFDGGGVTLTGGEVCVQHRAVEELLKGLKERGIHTAIETNATLDGFREILKFTDHLMTDFKHYDGEKLKSVTGVGNGKIKENFKFAIENGHFPHIRIPLINGFNAEEEDARGFAEYFSSLPSGSFDVELLPYHEYGKDKWTKLGREYTVENGFVSAKAVGNFKRILTDAGIKIVAT